MSVLSDEGIEEVEAASGIRYRFPIPVAERYANFICLVVSIGLTLGIAYLLFVLLDLVWGGALPVVLTILCTGLVLLVLGFAILFLVIMAGLFGLKTVGSNEVSLQHGILFSGVSWHRLRSGRRLPAVGLRQFSVLPFLGSSRKRRPKQTASWELFGVTLGEKSVHLQKSHSPGLLVALADELTKRCWGAEIHDAAAPPHVARPAGKGMTPEPFLGSTGPPQDSRVRVEEFPDGVTVIVPPLGPWRAAPSGYFWGRIYLAASIAASGVLIWGTVTGQVQWKPGEVEAITGFMILHLLASGYMVLDALTRGARQAVLAVIGNELRYRHRELLFATETRWDRTRIVDLRPRVAAFGLEGRKYQLLELRLSNGRVEQLLEGYQSEDLRWIATVLRHALGLPVVDPTD